VLVNRDLRDGLVGFAMAAAGAAAMAALSYAVPFVSRNLGALVAVVFLYVPVFYAWRRDEDLVTYGFRAAPIGKGVLLGVGVPLLIFPLFLLLYVYFYDLVCDRGQADWLRAMALPGRCLTWHGWDGVSAPAADMELLELAFVQVVVIALPEELFFRGFLHHLLERALPPRRRVLGGGIGWALVLSSALFAVVHLIKLDPRGLSVFFPGLLFGWMRSATGSIFAGTMCHALSNLFIHVLDGMFF
jgi:membrane protease YdiL (CAAX protease family)